MIVLAIETATIEVGVAVRGPAGLVASSRTRTGRRHAERLHVAIAEACAAAGVGLGDVEALAVDVGPGLFTGLRVGLAAVKALGLALGLPIAGVTSTDALAFAARHGASAGRVVVPVIDVRRGEVAWALPANGAGGDGGRWAGPPFLGTPSALVAALAPRDGAVLLVGDGALRYEDALREGLARAGGPALELAGDELAAPPVESLAELALSRLLAGDSVGAAELAPVYLRGADAEPGGWNARQPGVARVVADIAGSP